MWSANALACLTFEEVRIVEAPYKTAGILINRIINRHITQIRHCQQARNVGVVHQHVVTKTVHLESINLSVFGMIVNGIFLQGCFHFVCQSLAFIGQSRLFIHGCQYLGCLAE